MFVTARMTAENRTERYQIFLNLLMEKAKQMNQWSKVPELMDIMGGIRNAARSGPSAALSQ